MAVADHFAAQAFRVGHRLGAFARRHRVDLHLVTRSFEGGRKGRGMKFGDRFIRDDRGFARGDAFTAGFVFDAGIGADFGADFDIDAEDRVTMEISICYINYI